jgi:universal stress protein A
MKKSGVACAIDVNDFDQEVVDLAATFARLFGVDLNLLHVSLFPDPSNAAWPAYLGSPETVITDHRRLRAVKTSVEGVKLHYFHLSGIPTEQILKFAREHQPRMLILGTHGRQGLSRILGSVASRVVRHAECPVMVLRQRQNSQNFVDLQET